MLDAERSDLPEGGGKVAFWTEGPTGVVYRSVFGKRNFKDLFMGMGKKPWATLGEEV